MRVLITGASGLIGNALRRSLSEDGHEPVSLVRRAPENPHQASWDPMAGEIDLGPAVPLDAVLHLAGENLASGRWTNDKKARIRDSRVHGTGLVARAIAGLSPQPSVFVAASAIGYYGDRGDEELTETSPFGSGFLPDTCAAWEAAAGPACSAGIRTVHIRIGVVLSGEGGALARMLLPFKLGFGGRLGSGHQYISWIAIQDLVRIFRFVIGSNHIAGPINGVAPSPIRNRCFTRALGTVLHRPTILPTPALALRLCLGEMAQDLLLSSTRVLPERLSQEGFEFKYGDLEAALRAQLPV